MPYDVRSCTIAGAYSTEVYHRGPSTENVVLDIPPRKIRCSYCAVPGEEGKCQHCGAVIAASPFDSPEFRRAVERAAQQGLDDLRRDLRRTMARRSNASL
jgi:hypothetical protein